MALVYFAYGSNMCESRLKSPNRAPSADCKAVAQLSAYALRWHKKSNDGSGKADAWHTGNNQDVIWGVLFAMSDGDKVQLDKAEKGYHEVQITVRQTDGSDCQALTYVANSGEVDDSLKPYTWYKRLVVEGARQHQLPPSYVASIDAMAAKDDPNSARAAKHASVMC